MKEFGFSEERIRKTKRDIAFVSPFFLLFLVWFGLYVSDFSIMRAVLPFCLTSLTVLTIFLIEMYLIFRTFRKMKVVIGENEIVKHSGKTREPIPFNDVAKVLITKGVDGDTVGVRIGRNRGRPLYLGGFVDMDGIASLVTERVPGDASVTVRQRKHRWDSPAYSIPTLLFTAVLMTVLFSLGDAAVFSMIVVVSLVVGPAFLALRPLTEVNARFACFEIVTGVVFVLIGLAGLVFFVAVGMPL